MIVDEPFIITKYFEPVEDKPGYYWLNKRNCQIIHKDVLKKAFKIPYMEPNEKDEIIHKLLLSN